jgi:hypothetical protein
MIISFSITSKRAKELGVKDPLFEGIKTVTRRKWSDEDTRKYCEILNLSLCGEQQKAWVYSDNKPICTAYKKRSEDDNSSVQAAIEEEWDNSLPDMCTDFDGFVQRIEREKEIKNGL